MPDIRIEAPIKPTEDAAKVETAVRAIFPDAAVTMDEHWVRATSHDLDTLLKKTGEERVNDAARGALWRGRIDARSTRFEINKQAAFMGRINFNEITHPLGDLIVTVAVDDLEALLDRISPPTAAELAHGRAPRPGAKRAALHREEAELQQLGTRIDEWEEAPIDEDAWSGADEDWADDEDYDPLKRRRGGEEE